MKKYLVLLIPLLMTGCFGNAGSGVLESTCTKTTGVTIKEETTYNFQYKKGDITKMTIKKSYTNEVGLDGYSKAWNTFEGVTSEVDGNTITFEMDINTISDEVKKDFNIEYNYNNQIKKLKDLGYTCD